MIVLASLVALAAGLSSTAIGVYGGVLVPGLLLLGVDARFAAAVSLFLQVLVIPLAAGSHYRLGNFSRSVFTAAGDRRRDRRLHRAVLRRGAAQGRDRARRGGDDRARRRDRAGDAALGRPGQRCAPKATCRARAWRGSAWRAGFASGISGAGWGPIGVKLLILSRIDPRQAIGSSLFARVFMAAAAVVGYVTAQSAFQNVKPDFWLIVPLFAASIAPMIPGALVVSRLGRERATVAITLLSIGLALPTLIFGH